MPSIGCTSSKFHRHPGHLRARPRDVCSGDAVDGAVPVLLPPLLGGAGPAFAVVGCSFHGTRAGITLLQNRPNQTPLLQPVVSQPAVKGHYSRF